MGFFHTALRVGSREETCPFRHSATEVTGPGFFSFSFEVSVRDDVVFTPLLTSS